MVCDDNDICPLAERVRLLEKAIHPEEDADKDVLFKGDGCEFRLNNCIEGWLLTVKGSAPFMTGNPLDQRALHDFADWIKAHVPTERDCTNIRSSDPTVYPDARPH